MNAFDAAYLRATDDIARLPGPCLPTVLERLLKAEPDPDNDPSESGYRAAMQDTLNHITRSNR